MSQPIQQDDIERAIDKTESELSKEVVDDLLTAIQEDIVDTWNDTREDIKEGRLRVVREDTGVLVLADESGEFWREKLDALTNYENLLGIAGENAPDVVIAAHVSAASRLTAEDWANVNPVVVRKPGQ